ncbi:YbaN family protein [Zhongshania arctica]|uniref:Inner membrane protein n=1 Tax=Zhongshania arctica TaxID=3238302 RepID=A0ABV3TX78_9GAMM|tara:strand:+ start:13046 stop:13444 length:399 start_codon:yes stop_codon:yes gene_type:complete
MRLFTFLGFFFIALGTIGAFLPVLPTTPFILLAAGCFSRSSKKWHNWLLGNKLFGPSIHRWESRRCVNCKTKVFSLLSMTVMGGISLAVASHGFYFKLAAGALMLIGALCIIRIATCGSSSEFSPVVKNPVG